MKNIKQLFSTIILATLTLTGCALDPNSGNGMFSGNAGRAYIYTPEEQESMSADGTIATMLTPSEVRELMSNPRKITKPTGEVNYCDAGLPALVQARRNEALAAIDAACGGKDQYEIRHEGLGDLKARYVGNFQITPSCNRSRAIIFRCNGAQPKPDMRK